MKEGITIVYTPDVSPFKLSRLLQREDQRYVGDPEVQRLRDTYRRVRETYKDLPEKVAVVTYSEVFKRHIREIYEEIRAYPSLEGRTLSGYPGLDVLESIIELGKTDMTQPLADFMAYRNLMLLASCPLLTCDKSLKDSLYLLMTASVIADRDKVRGIIEETIQTLTGWSREHPFLENLAPKLKEMNELMNRTIPKWTDFDGLYAKVKSKFEKNKVSRNFPIYAAPSDWFYPALYIISLVEGVEKPEYVDQIMPYLLAGARAAGLPEVPDRELAEINRFNKEKFGKTTYHHTLESLLSALPSKKVIFTDIAIVDAIPQLGELPFEAIEYGLLPPEQTEDNKNSPNVQSLIS